MANAMALASRSTEQVRGNMAALVKQAKLAAAA
jgi:hypothetical protein